MSIKLWTLILAGFLGSCLLADFARAEEKKSAAEAGQGIQESSLTAAQIAIIVNTRDPGSLRIAEYYLQKRGVPKEQVIAVSMPTEEGISRAEYQDRILPAIQKRLRGDLAGKIRCLLTVRGVPLAIFPLRLEGDQLRWQQLVSEELGAKFGELDRALSEMNSLATGKPPAAHAGPHKFSSNPKIRTQEAVALLGQIKPAVEKARAALVSSAQPMSPPDQRKFAEILRRLIGGQGIHQDLARRLETERDPILKSGMLTQTQMLARELIPQIEKLRALDPNNPSLAHQRQRFQLIEQVIGLGGLCAALLDRRISFGDEDSFSAFDSELTLALWPDYPPGDWMPNTLRAYPADIPLPLPASCRNAPTLMVARLDGPTVEIARGLVDKALAGEQAPLGGKAYFDARGNHGGISKYGSYGSFDEFVRQAAENVRRQTRLGVTLDDKEPLFAVGACPDAILYCGWYSLQKYVDSFTFRPGAVGYHLASFEAQTLRNSESNVWCKRLLEKGITATIGPVMEPYLSSFPRPDLFFADLVSGKYTLAECYFRVLPFNSWMMILVGDPLYRPRYAGAGDAAPLPAPVPAAAAPAPSPTPAAPRPTLPIGPSTAIAPPPAPPLATQPPDPNRPKPSAPLYRPPPSRTRGFQPSL